MYSFNNVKLITNVRIVKQFGIGSKKKNKTYNGRSIIQRKKANINTRCSFIFLAAKAAQEATLSVNPCLRLCVRACMHECDTLFTKLMKEVQGWSR